VTSRRDDVTFWDALRAALAPGTGLTSGATLVLVALWRHSNFDGATWVSTETLALECKVSKRSVIRDVKILRDAEAVTVDRGGGRKRTNLYHVNPSWIRAQLATAPTEPNVPYPATESSFDGVNPDTASPLPGKGDSQSVNGDTGPAIGDTLSLNGATVSHSSALVVPLREEPCEVGGRKTPHASSHALEPKATATATTPAEETPKTLEEVAKAIAAAAAHLGGDFAKQGREIAKRFLEQRSAMDTDKELRALARAAGVERTALGVTFQDLFLAKPGSGDKVSPLPPSQELTRCAILAQPCGETQQIPAPDTGSSLLVDPDENARAAAAFRAYQQEQAARVGGQTTDVEYETI